VQERAAERAGGKTNHPRAPQRLEVGRPPKGESDSKRDRGHEPEVTEEALSGSYREVLGPVCGCMGATRGLRWVLESGMGDSVKGVPWADIHYFFQCRRRQIIIVVIADIK